MGAAALQGCRTRGYSAPYRISFRAMLQRSLPEARYSDGVLAHIILWSNNGIILFLHIASRENAMLHTPSSKSEGLMRKAYSRLSSVCLLERHLSGWLFWSSIFGISLISHYSMHSQTAGHKGIKKSWILIFHFYHIHSSPWQQDDFFLFIKDNWEN